MTGLPRWLFSFRRLALSLTVLAGLAILALAVDPVSRLQAAGSPVSRQVLPGHVLSALTTSQDLGLFSSIQPITLTVALKPADAAGLHLAASQASLTARAGQPPLTAADVGHRYGQSGATIQSLQAYFASFGLRSQPPPPDHLSFRVSGTVAQVQASLGVQLHRYQDSQGHAFFANDRDPQLPSTLAPSVQAIFGLDNYPALQRLHPAGSAPTPGAYVPSDLQTAYNVTPLYAQGWTGAGQTIGIIGCDAFLTSDIQNFRQAYNIPAATITSIPVDGGANGSDVEATLDLEWSGAIATGAGLRFYGFASSGGGCPFQGFLDAVTQAVTDNVAGVLSISLGACESTYNASGFLTAMENEFAAAALQQQGVFVASGDSGAFACGGSTPAVSYPASSAFVTAVGGTSLSLNADSTYQSETAWGSSTECGGPCGTGGGKSTVIAEPSWQQGAGLPNSGGRAVPDVALDADPTTGNVVYFTVSSSLGCTGFCGGIGGTNIATPEWAGLAAIANQVAGQRFGQLASLLYSSAIQAEQASANPPFHDEIAGNNLFYQAKAGWDFATGWGSPNTANLIGALAPPTATPSASPTSTLSPTATLTSASGVPNGAGIYTDANSQASAFNFPLVRTDTDTTTSITYDTILHLTNPQPNQLTLNLTFNKQDGTPAASVQETLNPFATLDFDTANAPASSHVDLAGFNGSATIASSGASAGMAFAATADVFAHKPQDATDNIDTYAGIATSAASYQPVAIVQFGYQSNLYLQNPSGSDATVSVTFYQHGTPVPTPSVPTLSVVVPAHGSTIVYANSVLASKGSYLGPLVITSTQPIATLLEYVAIQNGSGYGIAPMITATSEGRLLIPRYDVNYQVGSNLWNSGILIYNADATPNSYTLTFYDQNGNQIAQLPNVVVNGNETGNIGLLTPGTNPSGLQSNNFYSVVVTWTGNMAVAGVKAQGNYPGYNVVAASALPASQAAGVPAYLPSLRKTGDWDTATVSTGFALMNPDSTSQSYQISYYDANGNLARSDEIAFPPSGAAYFDLASDGGLASGQEFSAIVSNTAGGSPPVAEVEEYANYSVPPSSLLATPIPTQTPASSYTVTPTATITLTPTNSSTSTPSQTLTETPTATNSTTATETFTSTATASSTATSTSTPTATLTSTTTPTPSGSLGGTVRDNNTFALLTGVLVSATGPFGTRAAVTDDQGTYLILGLGPGVYTVTASLSGYVSTTATSVVGTGNATLNLTLSLPTPTATATSTATSTSTPTETATPTPIPGAIQGALRDNSNGTRLTSATISATGPSGSVSTTTDNSGGYTLQGLWPGSYAVTGSLAGYQSTTVTFLVASGVTTGGDFTLVALPTSTPTESATATEAPSATPTNPVTPVPSSTSTSQISLNPTSGPVGSQVTVTGGGFAANTAVSLLFDGQPVAGASCPTDGSGNISCTFAVPSVAVGSHVVTANGTVNGGTVNATATFTVTSLSVVPSSGVAGATVLASGAGFRPNQVMVFSLGALAAGGQLCQSQANGTFSNCSVTIPVSATVGSSQTLSATDGSVSSNTSFTVTGVTLSVSSGANGFTVQVTGAGFSPGGTVHFFVNNQAIQTTCTADSSGDLSNCSFLVGAAGVYTVTATDGTVSATGSFTATPAWSFQTSTLTPASVITSTIGATLTTTRGFGFAPNSTVKFTVGSTTAFSPICPTDANGTINQCTFSVPALLAGVYQVYATDGQNNVVEATLSDGTPEQLAVQASLGGTPLSFSVQEGSAFNGPLLTFTDSSGVGTLQNFTPSIQWGDGITTEIGDSCLSNSSSCLSFSQISGGGGAQAVFQVAGKHSYLTYGAYTVTIPIREQNLGSISSSVVTFTLSASVSDAPITTNVVSGLNTQYGVARTHLLVATVTDQNGFATVDDFLANGNPLIDWGDGSVPTAADDIVPEPNQPCTSSSPDPNTPCIFDIHGSHTYPNLQPSSPTTYTVTVYVNDVGGAVSNGQGTVVVSSADTGLFTVTSTSTATQTPTGTFTATSTSTATPTPTGTLTITSTNTATQTPTGTFTPTATETQTSTPSTTPTSTPSFVPANTPVTVVTVVGNATVELNIPPLASPIADLIISAATSTLAPQSARDQLVLAFQINATDANHRPITQLSAPLTLKVTFAPSLNSAANPWLAQVYTVENGVTQPLPTSITFDTTTNLFTAVAEVNHLSPFALYAPGARTPVPQVFVPTVPNAAGGEGW
jgi:subtilase family serine protease